MGGPGRERRRAVPAQAGHQPGQQRRQGRYRENVRDEQGLEQEGRTGDPGALGQPAQPEEGQERGGEGPGQTPGQVVQEERHEPETGHHRPPEAAVGQAGPDLKEADGQEDEQEAGEEPGKVKGGYPPGGQPVETLDAPGDVGLGIAGEEVAPEQGRVPPLLHPVELLADVVINDKRLGQGLEVRQNEDGPGNQGHRQFGPGGPGPGLLEFHGFRWVFQRRERPCSAGRPGPG